MGMVERTKRAQRETQQFLDVCSSCNEYTCHVKQTPDSRRRILVENGLLFCQASPSHWVHEIPRQYDTRLETIRIAWIVDDSSTPDQIDHLMSTVKQHIKNTTLHIYFLVIADAQRSSEYFSQDVIFVPKTNSKQNAFDLAVKLAMSIDATILAYSGPTLNIDGISLEQMFSRTLDNTSRIQTSRKEELDKSDLGPNSDFITNTLQTGACLMLSSEIASLFQRTTGGVWDTLCQNTGTLAMAAAS